MMIPLRSNCHETAPGSASEPPLRLKMFLISAPVRLRLSVRHSTMTATPFGCVALVRHLFVRDALELTGAPLDRAVDVVHRHRGVACLLDLRAQRRHSSRGRHRRTCAATSISRHRRAKSLPRAASAAPFLCLIECHFECPLIGRPPRWCCPSRNAWWTRRSPESSGWNVETQTAPERHSTGRPSCSASTSTPSPARSIAGARMNTPGNGPPANPLTSSAASKESDLRAIRVAPHRAVDRVEHRGWSGATVEHVVRQQDQAGARAERREPSRRRSRTGSRRPEESSSLPTVVDSPPGSTSASTRAQVGRGDAPRPSRRRASRAPHDARGRLPGVRGCRSS